MEDAATQISVIEESVEEEELLPKETEFSEINELYDECLKYLKQESVEEFDSNYDPDYESIEEKHDECNTDELQRTNEIEKNMVYKIENELKSTESINTVISEPRSERLRKLSQQLPKIIITQSNTSLNLKRYDDERIGNVYGFQRNYVKKAEHKSLPKIDHKYEFQQSNIKMDRSVPKSIKLDKTKRDNRKVAEKKLIGNGKKKPISTEVIKVPRRPGQSDVPKRLVSKRGVENVVLISNVPFERIRLLNDTFHTLINLRWRWIVTGTVVVHFAIWLVFAVFWYIAALAHYDFEPDPPKRSCVTGGHDFLSIFLASVEAQTTIGFGDRAIDEECPESIFLFIMQLILGTGLSGVLTCVVYAKLTRPEKLSRDGVGFSKKAVISIRDGRLCLMMRAWDLNYDHIISSEFTAHFVHTHRTKEGEVIRYYAQTLALQQRQFLLWPVTLLHAIDHTSPLYGYGPDMIANNNYEITVSLKGASASMGTFTQSQTSYLPREVAWGHRFPPVVKYDSRKQKYVIDHKKLDHIEKVDTPCCSAQDLASGSERRRHGRPARSRRVVLKDGEENVPVRSNISSKSIKYMRDIVNTVINSKWRFLILLMVFTHFAFWLLFAGIWYAVATSYADDIGDGKEHCVTGTSSFAGLLMMSVETQMTIGYGVRYPNEECPEAIIVMVFEIVVGTALSGGLSSLLFTKLIRPNRHVSSVGFSRKATVCLRDGELCLQFRVWDLMNVHIIDSTITAYMLKPIRTLEGELVKNYIHQLKLKQARAFLLWPITVVHVIDAESPLYDLSAQDCMDYRFEIVVCLQGSSKNMGTVTQSRSSYLSKEIIWGHRFKNVLHYSKENEAYVIDEENLHTVEQVETPLCSASRLKEFETDIKLSTNLLFTPTDMSISPTNLSICQDECSSKCDSVPSTPSLIRAAGTRRSFGWNFRRFQPEKYVNTEATVEMRRE